MESFLRERKLYRAYKKDERLKESKVKKFRYKTESHGVKQDYFLYAQNGKTRVVDAYSLESRGVTSQKISDIRKRGFRKKVVIRKYQGKDRKFVQGFNPSIIERVPYTNVIREDRTSPLKRKVGRTIVSITWFKANRSQTTEGGSQQWRLLTVKSERDKSFREAFNGAYMQCDFSPDDWQLNWVHYSYFNRKK